MIRLLGKVTTEPLKQVRDASTDPDFSKLFCGSPMALQVVGLIGMSETTVPYIDQMLDSDPNAKARWVLREVESYEKPRPWIPRWDRMLLVEFEYKIPILPTTDDGKPYSFDSPIRVTYVLDPARDYWPVWYQTRTKSGSSAFRVLTHSQQHSKGGFEFFPQQIVEYQLGTDDEVDFGLEVTDWKIGGIVNAATVFRDAAPDFTSGTPSATSPGIDSDLQSTKRDHKLTIDP